MPSTGQRTVEDPSLMSKAITNHIILCDHDVAQSLITRTRKFSALAQAVTSSASASNFREKLNRLTAIAVDGLALPHKGR